jgi:hypothetical protein
MRLRLLSYFLCNTVPNVKKIFDAAPVSAPARKMMGYRPRNTEIKTAGSCATNTVLYIRGTQWPI